MARLGIAGYETASGATDPEEDQDGNPGPAGRRTGSSSRIVRNTALTAKAKKLHRNRCQVCGLQLPTRFGTYSEAAHIRGLGRPHHGPDELPNLLVLCPAHHISETRRRGRLRPHPRCRPGTQKTPCHDRQGVFSLVGADGFEPPTSAL
ncbi:HNH endonuclease [Streptomyces sp. NPDC056773]|uniref:HNH endonuclease n=1 Tax=unclassified Streptomyces TaxID=2593676 RepID=UPI0036A1C187